MFMTRRTGLFALSVVALCMFAASPADAAVIDLDKDFINRDTETSVTYGRLFYNRRLRLLQTTATIRNVSLNPIVGPFFLRISGISQPGMIVANSTNTDPSGNAILVSPTAVLNPNGTLAITVQFGGTWTVRASWASSVFAGQKPPPPAPGELQPPVLDPAHTRMTADTVVTIAGTATGANTVDFTGPGGNGSAAVMPDGTFSASVPLASNRINLVFFTALSGSEISATTTTAITQDSQPPEVFIDFPLDGATLTVPTIDVAGRVSDLLSGFVGLEVEVNNIEAVVDVGIGTNGTFIAADVPLTEGVETTITATATDELGNSATATIKVTRIALEPDEPQMEIISGNAQTGTVNEVLANKIVVKVTQGGNAFANKAVTFDVIRSNGRLSTANLGGGTALLQIKTDVNGEACCYWQLGGDAGCGNNRIAVTSKDIAGTTFFCASAAPGAASQINVGNGNNQKGEVGTTLAEPLRAYLNDACNGIASFPVTFEIRQGGGTLSVPGGPSGSKVTVPTSQTGHVEVLLTLGDDPGNNVVTAEFSGNLGAPATFVAIGLARVEDGKTSFSGVVLDNAGCPIGGAECKIDVGGTEFSMLSDGGGNFNFPDIGAAGKADLFVDGSVATMLNGQTIPQGTFPSLHFEPVLVHQAHNSLSMPVRLPRLDSENVKSYSKTKDTILTVAGMAGLEMTIKAGSMTLKDGTVAPDGTLVQLNQVHHDDIPMPMPDGAAPPFAWTLQPSGAKFDPPICISYPNMSGLPPGAIAYFLSFNHDTARFEIIATGAVTEDGSCIESDPGVGIRTAGWGCNCPPYSVTGECERSCEEENPPGVHFEPGDAMKFKIAIPLVKNNIKASPAETMIWNLRAEDKDQYRDCPGDPWTKFPGTGPYEYKLTVSGPAEWNSAGSGLTMVTRSGLNTGNVFLVIDSGWDGTGTITVTATLTDNAVLPTSPDTGHMKDPSISCTWTVVKRVQCPTSLTTVFGSNNVWRTAPALYGYRGDPDVPPAGRPDYEGETILESFTTVTALGFSMTDLKTAWITANPTVNTPNKVAVALWTGSNNGTFVFNTQDKIFDQHGGFGTTAPFKASAFADADGIGYSLPQFYSCGPNQIGAATIKRRFTNANGVQINKSAP